MTPSKGSPAPGSTELQPPRSPLSNTNRKQSAGLPGRKRPRMSTLSKRDEMETKTFVWWMGVFGFLFLPMQSCCGSPLFLFSTFSGLFIFPFPSICFLPYLRVPFPWSLPLHACRLLHPFHQSPPFSLIYSINPCQWEEVLAVKMKLRNQTGHLKLGSLLH